VCQGKCRCCKAVRTRYRDAVNRVVPTPQIEQRAAVLGHEHRVYDGMHQRRQLELTSSHALHAGTGRSLRSAEHGMPLHGSNVAATQLTHHTVLSHPNFRTSTPGGAHRQSAARLGDKVHSTPMFSALSLRLSLSVTYSPFSPSPSLSLSLALALALALAFLTVTRKQSETGDRVHARLSPGGWPHRSTSL
jgi:hypothetical protein